MTYAINPLVAKMTHIDTSIEEMFELLTQIDIGSLDKATAIMLAGYLKGMGSGYSSYNVRDCTPSKRQTEKYKNYLDRVGSKFLELHVHIFQLTLSER